MELVAAKNRMEYIIIKLQHLGSINQMLQETRLPEILDLLQRGALHLNVCQLNAGQFQILKSVVIVKTPTQPELNLTLT